VLSGQINQKIGALGGKTVRCEESRRRFLTAEAKKRAAEQEYKINAKKLADGTLKIRQKCTEDIEGMETQKALLLAQAQSTNARALQNILNNFRLSISV